MSGLIDNETKENFAKTDTYMSQAAMLSSFAPMQNIKSHFCGFHLYASDPSRVVVADHFCSHLTEDIHTCLIYDGDGRGDSGKSGIEGKRLVGVEYIITEKLFDSLPGEEKKFWHSHQHEVISGSLVLVTKSGIPEKITDEAEGPAMRELQRTYGKAIQTWHTDKHPDLPIGPPQLLMSTIRDGWIPEEMIKKRDEHYGVSTVDKRKLRESYLPEYEPRAEADHWLKSGKGMRFVVEEFDLDKSA